MENRHVFIFRKKEAEIMEKTNQKTETYDSTQLLEKHFIKAIA